MLLLLSAVAVLVPLIITPGLLFHFDVTPKIAVLLIGTAGAGLVVLTTAPSRSRLGIDASEPRASASVWWFVVSLGIQALVLVAATASSPHWRLSVVGTNWRQFGLITQLAIAAFAALASITLAGRPDRIRFLLRSIAASGIFAAAYGTLQYFGFDPWLPASAYVIGEGEWAIVRPPSTLGHASYAAAFYLFAGFTGLGLSHIEPGRFWRSAGSVAAALCSVAIVLSGTRAAVLGLIAGAIVVVAGMRPRATRRTGSITAIVAIALTAFYFSPAGQRLRGRVRWAIEDARGGARLLLWRDSLRMGALRPLAGWGPETFSTEFPRFQSRELAKAYPDFYYESPHNIFVDALVSTGLPGCMILITLCGLGFYAAWIARQTALGAALAAGLVAQQFTAFIAPTALYFYLTIAILVALACRDPITVRRSLVATIVLIAAFVPFAVAMLASDHLLARASRALDRGDLSGASEFHRRSRKWQPFLDTSDLWYSRALMRFPQALQEGYAAAERASRSAEDRHNAFYNLATYCAARNDFAGVENNLRQAIHWAPNWFKPHWTLAKALQLAGRLNEAESEAALAVELDGGKHAEVTRTLDEIRRALHRR